jgi:DNA-binding transcriptional regulator YiaG
MPNIANILKAEIARVARKELRAEIEPLRKSLAQYRSTIAALNRQVAQLERQVKRGAKSAARGGTSSPTTEEAPKDRQVRFSAERLAAHRQKLGLSAADYAKLAGASALSVYKWESGKTRPRQAQIQALAALRALSKSEVQERLAA